MRKNERTEAKRVILEIVQQSGGKFAGTTKLYKAFYFAHLYYADMAPDYLTNWPIVRMPHGPGIDSGADLLNELVDGGHLRREVVPTGPYEASCYHRGEKPFPGEALSAAAVAAIKKAAEFVAPYGAAELSNLTHEFSRSFLQASDGQRMNYPIDLIPEEEFETRRQTLEALRYRLAALRRKEDRSREPTPSPV